MTPNIETHVVVCQIVEAIQHPNADRLKLCQVNDGTPELRQVVCGATNFKVGDKVPLALPGAILPGDFKIKAGKLRGEKSDGMLCSGSELGITADSEGLLILPESAEVGKPFQLKPFESTVETFTKAAEANAPLFSQI